MQLEPVVQALHDVLARVPPKNSSLDAMREFHRTKNLEAQMIACHVTKARREELVSHIHAYIRATSLSETTRMVLMSCQGTLESTANSPLSAGESASQTSENTSCELPFEIYEGHTAASTALLRTAFFADAEPGTRIFQALGMKFVEVERGAVPLNDTHLVVTAYLVSLVRTWDKKLGANLVFNAWDAVRKLGWAVSTLSLQRLKDAIDCLANTTVRVYLHLDEELNFDTEREEAAPMIARRVTEMRKEKYSQWEVQLTSTLLNILGEHHTFLSFETLAALPSGCTTSLYAFVATEKNKISEWDVESLGKICGLTSQSLDETKRALKKALLTLISGSVTVKTRGRAVRDVEGRGELVENSKGELIVRSTGSVTRTFSPPLEAFEFRKTQKGKYRVKLIKR